MESDLAVIACTIPTETPYRLQTAPRVAVIIDDGEGNRHGLGRGVDGRPANRATLWRPAMQMERALVDR